MARLGDICEILDSKRVPITATERQPGPYPYYGANGVQDYVADYIFDDDLVLLAEDGGNFGSKDKPIAYRVSGKCWVNNHAHVLKPKEGLNVDYLCYSLMFYDVTGLVNGATRQKLTQADMRKMEIPLPSLDEQRKIAAVLDKVSDLIAKRRQQLDKLDELIKAKFVEMFYNIDSNTNWPVVTMADISTDMRTGPFGSALHHDEFVETGIFVLGIDNAVENKFSYNRMRYITEEKYEQLKRYTVRPGDIIITIMGTVGRSAVIPDNIPKAINTKHLACLTIDRSKAQPTFICSAFQMHPEIRQQLTGQAKGAIMDGLNLTIIKKIHFKLPPIEIQDKFVEFFNITEKTKTTISKSLEKLETLKKALMQEYFG